MNHPPSHSSNETQAGAAQERDILISAKGISKRYPIRRGLLRRVHGWVDALQDVDLELRRGEIVGLVGESGSGKTTLGRVLTRLIEPSAGQVTFEGRDLLALKGAALRESRKDYQVIFQDPYGSLNPRMRVGALIEEPLRVHGLGASVEERRRRVGEWLDRVGLPASSRDKYPHEFSGGQRQRIGIARALASEPSFVVADEPVSALDVSIQAQIVKLLEQLQRDLGLTLLFISHDLSVVREIADRVAVLYAGSLVEKGPTAALYASPAHPYTASLLSAVPIVSPSERRKRIVLSGEVPSPTNRPSGCSFHPRCPIAEERCARVEPQLEPSENEREVACHLPGGLPLETRTQ